MTCSRFILAVAAVLTGAVSASAQRQWIIYPTLYQGNGWQTVASGDFDGRAYKFYYQMDGVIRAYWDLTKENCIPVAPNTDLFPVKPAMYAVEQWAPSVMPAGVPAWEWAPIETTFDGPGWDHSEEATQNLFIPWNGAYGTNHQWIGVNLPGTGAWVAAGTNGPHCPDTAACNAAPDGANSRQMWMKRNSTLYLKWNFGWSFIHPVTALRLTEVYSDNPTCGAATSGGPIDFRCVGNADPLYNLHERFANNPYASQQTTTIDGDNALAVNNYTVWVCLDPGYPYNVPLSPGLAASGQYIAHLADRDVPFLLRYDGLNALKWRTGNAGGEFDSARVITLNQVAGREFVPGNYQAMNLLTASSGGRGHKLKIQAVYNDSSTEMLSVNLYDWFNNNGDASSIAVGVDGYRREAGASGFETLSKYGDSVDHGSGGNTSGAFFFVHTVSFNPCKVLAQINVSTDFPSAPSLVTESREGGSNYANFTSTGAWTQETAKSTTGGVSLGIGSLAAGAGQSGTTAVFNITPAVTASYNVSATWASGLDAASQTAFVITSDDTPVTVFKNQRNDGNGWNGLTQVSLTAGNTYTVTLDAAQSSGGPRVYADAVRWETAGINANLLAASLEPGSCCSRPWADADGDHDVDQADFAVIQSCLSLNGATIVPGCECYDANGSGAVDLDDVADFIDCGLGPEIDYVHNASPPYWPNWPAGCPNQPAN